MVLDSSSSVKSEDLDQLKRAGLAVAAALRPVDVASVLTFDEKIALKLRSSSSPRDVQNAILGVRQYPSYSALWDATIAGAAFAVETPGRPVVIALTDLGDNASWLTQSPQARSPRDNRTGSRRCAPPDGRDVGRVCSAGAIRVVTSAVGRIRSYRGLYGRKSSQAGRLRK
jgi:uncharacterized protein (DUF58 family)